MSKSRRQNKTKKRGGSAVFEKVRSVFRTPDFFPYNKLPKEMRQRFTTRVRMAEFLENPGKNSPYNGRTDPVKVYCKELSKAKSKKEYLTPEMEADLEFCKSNNLI